MTSLAATGGLQPEDYRLTPRDLAILNDLRRVRLLTGRHVQRLHLSDGSPLTQARRTRSVLQRLTDAELLHRYERRIGGVHAGSSGHLFGLATRGQKLLDGRGPAGGVRRRRPWDASRLFFDHVLAVSELYVQLREAERRGDIELLEFDAEPAGWRYWFDADGTRQVLKPDAFVVLGRGDFEYRSFVEVDCSTESRTVIRRKGEVYVDYWNSGVEQRQADVFPKVAWLVQDVPRLVQIVEALARIDADGWRLFQVTTFDEALTNLTSKPP